LGLIPEVEEVKVLMNHTGIGKDQATGIVRIANIVRSKLPDVKVPVSRTKDVAFFIANNMPLRYAWEYALVQHIPASQRKELVDLLNSNVSVLVDIPTKANDYF
jgi:hypothetical protein